MTEPEFRVTNAHEAYRAIAGVCIEQVEVSFRGIRIPEATPPSCEQDPAIAQGGMLLRDFLAQEMSDPAVDARMRDVRKEVGRRKKRLGLAKLRLQAGLTQHELALKIGTQQPAVARWEAGSSITSMSIGTIFKLAKAFGCHEHEVVDAIKEQTQTNARYETV